jgi:hypothetical protein
MQHKNEDLRGSSPIVTAADIDKKTISGCYGIDRLFAKKSRKLSFAEFCDGLKDIFLAIPIFTFKLVAVAFDCVKRPICAFGLMCAVAVTLVANVFAGRETVEDQPIAKEIALPQNFPAIGMKKSKIISDIDEHMAVARSQVEKKSNSQMAIVPRTNSQGDGIATADSGDTVHAFEAKLRDFFAEHAISDVACANGRCRLKLQNGIFAEHSILCNHPRIVLESSTDDEIIFSDGAGTFCALTIESLLH